ncbi:MAG: orotate phosphoribosyltransferase, partial [Hydrotalea sp.]|nr:orotate phosphoribosyltransferase [Hydrotalea sp.]
MTDDIAKKTAEILWRIGAVNFRDEPYQFASGIKSPIYMNCRAPIFHPAELKMLMDMGMEKIAPVVKQKNISVMAGGETAGIPYAMCLAERFHLPMVYVRKKPKGYGMNASIEGGSQPGARALLVEDLATNGGSKINFVKGLRQAEFLCNDSFVIFYYGIFGLAADMAAMDITLHHLTTADDVFAHAKEKNLFDTKTLSLVEQFMADPMAWSAAHGG